MSIINKREFAKLCNTTTSALPTWVKRGKIECDEDGNYDLESHLNKSFLEKRGIDTGGEKNDVPIPKSKDSYKQIFDNINLNDNVQVLNRKKVAAEILKRKEEIEKLRIDNDKKRGELIPTELVGSIILLLSESIKVSYLDACDKLIILFAQKKKMNNSEKSEMKKELIGNINDAVDASLVEANRGIKRIVDEYSDKRGVGEHD